MRSWLATLGAALAGFASFAATAHGNDGGAPPRVAATWYAGWHAADFPLHALSWDKYTHVTYAFAETTPDVHTLALSDADKALLPEFVRVAHAHNVKALVSVGGWTGSRFFSTAVASAANRTAFAQTVLALAATYNLDGLDFDWEYPTAPGIGCNTLSPNDTANFLAFLRTLRATPVGGALVLTAATALTPFADPSGAPSADVSGFARVLDWIAIMNYDIWGPWSPTAGPNAPLEDACAGTRAAGSAASAVRAWTRAGVPTAQIVLGVPAYGHSFRVRRTDAFENRTDGSGGSGGGGGGGGAVLALYPPFDAADLPTGDAWDDPAGTDVCGAPVGAAGNWDFWGLVRAGWLDAHGRPARGVFARWDACAHTPFVYNATSEVLVAYDDARSFAAKGAFVARHALRGFAMWEAGGDWHDTLLDAIRAGARFG